MASTSHARRYGDRAGVSLAVRPYTATRLEDLVIDKEVGGIDRLDRESIPNQVRAFPRQNNCRSIHLPRGIDIDHQSWDVRHKWLDQASRYSQ